MKLYDYGAQFYNCIMGIKEMAFESILAADFVFGFNN